MKRIFNNLSEFYNINKKAIITLSLFFGIFWSFLMALTEVAQPLLFFVINFFLILPFGLIGGILFAFFFIKSMQGSCGEYIIAYIEARVLRLFLRKYDKSIEPYKTTITVLKSLRPKGNEKAFKKYYLHSTYNDLAICYSKLEDKKLAEKYIKKAVRYLPNKKKQKYLDKMYKKYINEKPQITDKKRNIIIFSTIIILFVLSILANILWGYLYSKSDNNTKYIKVATTDDTKKADEIQNLITNMSGMPTLREVDGSKTIISVKGCSKRNRAYATVMIAGSPYYDTNIGFSTRIFGIGKENSDRKELDKILQTIPGVLNVFVELNFPESMFFECNNKEKPSAIVNIFTSTDFEQQRVEKTVRNVLLGTVCGLEEENISINFDILEKPNTKLIKQHKERLEWLTKIYNNKIVQ